MQSSPPDPNAPQKSRRSVPETVGATDAPFKLNKGITTVSFEIHPPSGPGFLREDGQARRVILRIENMRSRLAAPSFNVYLNLPPTNDPENHPDLRAATLSMFGLVELTGSNEKHPGNGLTYSNEVTGLFHRLKASRDWDGRVLHVSFDPIDWQEYPLDVTVGRVSLLVE